MVDKKIEIIPLIGEGGAFSDEKLEREGLAPANVTQALINSTISFNDAYKAFSYLLNDGCGFGFIHRDTDDDSFDLSIVGIRELADD